MRRCEPCFERLGHLTDEPLVVEPGDELCFFGCDDERAEVVAVDENRGDNVDTRFVFSSFHLAPERDRVHLVILAPQVYASAGNTARDYSELGRGGVLSKVSSRGSCLLTRGGVAL